MAKPQKFLAIIGGLCGLYGLGVLLIIGTSHWFNFAGIILFGFFLCMAFCLPYFIKLPSVLKLPVYTAFILCIAVFSFFEILIIEAGNSTPRQSAAYVIVLGAKVNGSQPSLALSHRIASAAEYMEKNPGAVAVATGGRGTDEAVSESGAIVRGLISSGIEPERILSEEESTSTRENLMFALDLITARGDSGMDSVVIVSSDFHLYRAEKLAKKIGYTNVSGQGAASMPYLLPHYYAREFVAVVKEKMDGNL